MRTGAVACVALTTTTLALTALVVRAGAASVVYRLAAIGDYGTNTTAEAQVAALVASWGVSDIITMGDNNYMYALIHSLSRSLWPSPLLPRSCAPVL